MSKTKHIAAKKGGVSSPHTKHAAMRSERGAVVVRHPSLPGKDMRAVSPDYAEVPFGSLSKHGAPGGISGGLGPFQSAEGAERGEYAGN